MLKKSSSLLNYNHVVIKMRIQKERKI